ncbi:MAG: protein kinase [Deltaproteobacteria bacterium]|nr:protein kinase [Deltaproteobacteria bacterium]
MSLSLSPLDGRVELRGLLGEGGMGEVHRGWDARLERAVAVKLLRGQDPRDAERLVLEARLQARVEHPHVVKVHEVGTLAGRPCIVLQLVEGRTLAQLALGLPLEVRVELVRQAAEGLHAAHGQGLVHRDVKPSNVLVEERDGGPVALLTDFGLARGEEPGLTRTGLPPGTLDYMSPEQLVGPGPVDFRSDVYALGATLYAVLAGRAPFRTPTPGARAGEDDVQVMRRILETEPEPLGKVAAAVPGELATIAARAMEKEPGARYPSAAAFAEDLARLQRGEPIRARQATPGERLSRWARRNRTSARALAVAALALLLAAGWTLWRSRQAGVEALEAARVAALAETMESRLRMELLSPPHDLRPALDRIRSEVESLRPLAERDRSGPAWYALARGLDLLDDLDGARAAYEAAWAQGFRTLRTAEGLGVALGRVYQREHRRARETLEPTAREERLAALRRDLLDPALGYLARGEASGGRGPYLRAVAASLDEDHEAVQKLVAEVLAGDPSRYEARLLEAESGLRRADLLLAGNRPAEALAAYASARVPLDEALAWGRSDPRVFRAVAELHDGQARVLAAQGKDPGLDVARALEWLDRGLALDADSPSLLLARGVHHQLEGRFAGMRGQDPLPSFEQSAVYLRRAIERDPSSVRARQKLAYSWYVRAFQLREARKPSLDAAREGLRVVEEAIALAPMDPELRGDAMSLRNEEGEALFLAGREAAASFAAAVSQGQEALRLRVTAPASVRMGVAAAELQLAREVWFGGGEPRAHIQRAMELTEAALKDRPGDWRLLVQATWTLGTVAEYLQHIGEDGAPALRRAMELADGSLAGYPGRPASALQKGQLLLVEADRRLAAGEDAEGPIEEAERWLRRAAGGGLTAALSEQLPRIALARGRSLAARQGDPSAELARAEALLRELERATPGDAHTLTLLATCAVERAAWLRERGRPRAEEARRGLAVATRALEVLPRDPQLWVARARLQGLADDPEAARKSLASAYAIQPRVRATREARSAEAELAVPAAPAR